jgi:hypothetical protein
MNNYIPTPNDYNTYGTRYHWHNVWTTPDNANPTYALAPTITVVFYNSTSSTAIKTWASSRLANDNRPNISHLAWPAASTAADPDYAWSALKGTYLTLVAMGYV